MQHRIIVLFCKSNMCFHCQFTFCYRKSIGWQLFQINLEINIPCIISIITSWSGSRFMNKTLIKWKQQLKHDLIISSIFIIQWDLDEFFFNGTLCTHVCLVICTLLVINTRYSLINAIMLLHPVWHIQTTVLALVMPNIRKRRVKIKNSD